MPQPPGYGQPTQVHGPLHEPTEYLRGQVEPKLRDKNLDPATRRKYLDRYSLLDELHENSARKQQLLEIYQSGQVSDEDLIELDLAMEEVNSESRRIETEIQKARERFNY